MSLNEHGRGQPDSPDPEEQFWAVLHGEIAPPADLMWMEMQAMQLAESMEPNVTQEFVARSLATGAELSITTTAYGEEPSAGKHVSLSMGRQGDFKSPFELCFTFDGKLADHLACNNPKEITDSMELVEELLASPQLDEVMTVALHIQAYLIALKQDAKTAPDLYEGWGKTVSDISQEVVATQQGDKAVELREWSFALPDLGAIEIKAYSLKGYPENLDEPVLGETENERQARKDMPRLEITSVSEEERKIREYLLTQSGDQTLEVSGSEDIIDDEIDPDQLLISDNEDDPGMEVNPPREPDVKAIIILLNEVIKAEEEGIAPFDDDEIEDL